MRDDINSIDDELTVIAFCESVDHQCGWQPAPLASFFMRTTHPTHVHTAWRWVSIGFRCGRCRGVTFGKAVSQREVDLLLELHVPVGRADDEALDPARASVAPLTAAEVDGFVAAGGILEGLTRVH